MLISITNKRIFGLLEYFKNYDFETVNFAFARSLIALGSLSTLLFTDISFLIDPIGTESGAAYGEVLYKISIFNFLSDNIVLAKWICVILLCSVISGYYPKITCFFHWWVSTSMVTSFRLFDGGDFLTQIITLLLIPICMQDNRKNHWDKRTIHSRESQALAGISYSLIRLQVAIVYLVASISKLSIHEWANGTAVYYWVDHPLVAAPSYLQGLLSLFTHNSLFVVIHTWSVLALEFGLFLCLFFRPKIRRYFLFIAVGFHFMIFLVHGLFSFFLAMSGAIWLYLNDFKKG